MIALSVNVNKIATLRNSRGGDIPNLVEYTEIIMNAGVQGITVHPRKDERHITKKDTTELSNFINRYNKINKKFIEYNIEGAPDKRYLDLVLNLKPDQATLVPVREGEITSDHGFDLKKEYKKLRPIIKKLKDSGIRVSLFLDTKKENFPIAKDIGADRIEFYTGPFANDFESGNGIDSFLDYEEAARTAMKSNLEINAGHDLDTSNLKLFHKLSGLKEVSIGHRLISRALLKGLEPTIKEYLEILRF